MTAASVPGSAVVRSIIRYSPSVAAAFAFGVGVAVLAGWVVDVEALTRLGAPAADVKANAAVALGVAALGCWFARPGRRRARPWLVGTSGAAVSAIGLLTLAEYAFGADLGIDELLVADERPSVATSHAGRMGPNTAFCLTLLGLALVSLAASRRAADRVAHGLLVSTAAVALVALGGYAVGIPDFYRVASWTQMAPATAVTLVVLATGTLAARADFLPMRLLANDGAAGTATRRLLPAAIVLPPAVAWLSRRGHEAGLYGNDVGDLLLVGSLVAVLAALVLKLAVGAERAGANRDAAEEARRTAEARYRTLVEHLPLVTYATARHATTTSAYISPQVTDLLGYAADEWLADPELLRNIVHPEDRDRVAALDQAEAGARRRSSEYRVVARDGRTVWIRDDAVLERDEAGDDLFVQGFLIDITAQKQAEAELSLRNAELQTLHETAMGVLKGLELDALLETILSRAAELAGTAHAYLYLADGDELEVRLAKGIFEENIGYRLRAGEGIAGRVYEAGQPLVVDDYHVWSGRRRDFDPFQFHVVIGVPLRSGRDVVGVLGLAHDDETRRFTPEETALLERFGDLVSLALENARLYAAAQDELRERRRTEEALREAEAKYRALVENVPLVIYLDALDKHSSAIYMSPQIESILGYSPEEWLADPELFPKLLHPDDRERVMGEVERTNEADRFSSEYRLVARDGREVWFRDEARHIRDPDGKPVLAQGFMLDITEQKRAEQALRESEERFRSLVSNVPGAIFRCTFDSRWRFDFVSGAIEEISGYAADDFVGAKGRTLNSIVHPDDLPGVRERFEAAARAGEVYELEYRLVHASGEVRWGLERGQGTPRPDGTLVLDGAIFDITDRHRAQEELRESQRQLAHAQAVAHVGSWHWDVASDTIAWSDELYQVYGLERGEVEMTYASIRDFVHPDDRSAFDAAVGRAHETGEPFTVDYRIGRPDGSVRFVHARGEVVLGEGGPEKMLGTAHDVTERMEAEQRLRDAEVRYRTLVEHLPLGTYIRPLDVTSANVYASPQVEELLGYSVEEWKEDPELLARIVHPDDRERVLAEAVRVRRTGEPFRGEYRYIARDGRVVWVQYETYVVRDQDGKPYPSRATSSTSPSRSARRSSASTSSGRRRRRAPPSPRRTHASSSSTG